MLLKCGLTVFFSMVLPAHSRPWPLIQFRKHFSQTVGLLGRVISPPQGRYLNTGQHKHKINAHQTSMPWEGFKPTTPAFEWAKTVHALDRVATVYSGKNINGTVSTTNYWNWIFTSQRSATGCYNTTLLKLRRTTYYSINVRLLAQLLMLHVSTIL
jgi:hypothetical protein